MGDPASSYATAGIALGILEALKPPHPDLPILHQGGDVIEWDYVVLHFYLILLLRVSNILLDVMWLWYCVCVIIVIIIVFVLAVMYSVSHSLPNPAFL